MRRTAEQEIMRAAQKRQRQREWYMRQKSRDCVSFYEVPLPASVIHALIAELKVSESDDRPIAERAWRKMVGLVIAEAVKKALKKK